MFLVHCTLGPPHLQGTRTILDQRTTRAGILTVLACRCGGHAILLGGVQRAHLGPDELPLGTAATDRSPAGQDTGGAEARREFPATSDARATRTTRRAA